MLYTASLIPCVLPNVPGPGSTPPPTAVARPASSPEQVTSATFFQTKSSAAQQCWGSGSVCFWDSWIWTRIH